jgi:O-antigen/teichoic acid export membrane protein
LALGFQRSLISDPLLTNTSSLRPEKREDPTRAALTMVLLWALATTLLMVLVGYAVPSWGRGFVLFTPWLLPALVQDFFRAVLFRDYRGRSGAVNDVVWLLVMGVTAPLAITAPTKWVIVAIWGLGAFVAAIVGSLQVGIIPGHPVASVRWWKMRAWPLARWLGAESIVYTLSSQFLILILADVVGTRSLGGLRAVSTMFAPLTLITPALVLPGLPAVARALSAGFGRGLRLSIGISVMAIVLAGSYLAIALLLRDSILQVVFGDAFSSFQPLVVPIGVSQLPIAATLGFVLLLKARGRGRGLLMARIIGSVSLFAVVLPLAYSFGVLGAAWGLAVGSIPGGCALLFFAVTGRSARRPESMGMSIPSSRSVMTDGSSLEIHPGNSV